MIIVTGAAGLFGVNFLQYLLENTNEGLIAIDSLFGGNEDYIPKHDRVIFLKGDLSDKKFQEELEAEIFKAHEISYVFHFAAYAAEGLSPFIRCFNYENNLVSTAFIVNMSIQYGVKRLVFTSSMATYGEQQPPFDEDMTPRPIDPYGVAKYAAEMDVQIAGKQHSLEYCIIRPHNVYGPYQNIWDPYRNVLGIWMYKSLRNDTITIYGDGNQKRAFSYIADILPCLWKAATDERAKNQIINLGGIKAYTIKEAATTMSLITGNEKVEYLEARHEVKNAYSTYQKSIDLLDFEDKTSLQDGLQQMWNWAKQQKDREQKRWSKYEIDKKLYSFWK
jgi:UDP-glucose 4-epimerase